MEMSIVEAQKGLGWTSPNPPVGCVIVDKNHRLLSRAHHKKAGEDHAERLAVKMVKNKNKLKGAYVYVTLEPCAHQGKTPSCAEFLSQQPISSVIYGIKDPNPKTYSKGLSLLRKHKISVKKYSQFFEELNRLYEVFYFNMKHHKPWVTLKIATTLDGMIASKKRERLNITGEASRKYARLLRAQHDACLIGVQTFLSDNPLLTNRDSPFKNKKNKIIILDAKGEGLKFFKKSKLIKAHKTEQIIWVVSSKINCQALPCDVIKLPCRSSGFNLKTLCQILYKKKGIGSLFVEGGAETFSSFLNQNQAQRVYQFVNPSFLGGQQGLLATQTLGHFLGKKRKKLQESRLKSLGEDILITGLL